jgi:hypothetical protein
MEACKQVGAEPAEHSYMMKGDANIFVQQAMGTWSPMMLTKIFKLTCIAPSSPASCLHQ